MSDAAEPTDAAAGGASQGVTIKKQLLETYKDLEVRLSSDALSVEERTRDVCAVWAHVRPMCRHAVASSHRHLLHWPSRHTYNLVLLSEWQKPKCATLRESLEAALASFEANAEASDADRDWEQCLLNKARTLRRLSLDPWAVPVLKALLDQQAEPPSDESVLEWLVDEKASTFLLRLQQLSASKCEDLALSLLTNIMQHLRTDDAEGAPDERLGARLRADADFTPDALDKLLDVELMLLHKLDKTDRCIQLVKQASLTAGKRIVERLCTRASVPAPSASKRLWKNVAEVATLAAQVLVTRCMVIPMLTDDTRKTLYACACGLGRCVSGPRLRSTFGSLAALASTAAHLHCLALAVKKVGGDEQRPFVCELYVRALTTGMNELERLKLGAECSAEARQLERTLAWWLLLLADLLVANPRVYRECVLTAFSVHPAGPFYEKVVACPDVTEEIAQVSEPAASGSSEFGSWASDSRPTRTSFVKNSETLALSASADAGACAVSSAVLECEGLGLSAELCQDLAVLLSGPRIKTLHWQMDRVRLLENCRAYMERTAGGTLALTAAIRFPNLDLSSIEHLPFTDGAEDEYDQFYGIEKGYEHLVELEEEEQKPEAPFDSWQDVMADLYLSDSEPHSGSDDSDDSDYLHQTAKHRKPKTEKHRVAPDDDVSDPLSFDNEDKPPTKERSKKKRKDGAQRSRSKDGHGKNKKKDKPKRKKEHKEKQRKPKKEPQDCTPLSQLVGLQVQRVGVIYKPEKRKEEKKHTKKEAVTDSDYDSQGRNYWTPSPDCTDDSQAIGDLPSAIDRTAPKIKNEPTSSNMSEQESCFSSSTLNIKKPATVPMKESKPTHPTYDHVRPGTSLFIPNSSKTKLKQTKLTHSQSFHESFANAIRSSVLPSQRMHTVPRPTILKGRKYDQPSFIQKLQNQYFPRDPSESTKAPACELLNPTLPKDNLVTSVIRPTAVTPILSSSVEKKLQPVDPVLMQKHNEVRAKIAGLLQFRKPKVTSPTTANPELKAKLEKQNQYSVNRALPADRPITTDAKISTQPKLLMTSSYQHQKTVITTGKISDPHGFQLKTNSKISHPHSVQLKTNPLKTYTAPIKTHTAQTGSSITGAILTHAVQTNPVLTCPGVQTHVVHSSPVISTCAEIQPHTVNLTSPAMLMTPVIQTRPLIQMSSLIQTSSLVQMSSLVQTTSQVQMSPMIQTSSLLQTRPATQTLVGTAVNVLPLNQMQQQYIAPVQMTPQISRPSESIIFDPSPALRQLNSIPKVQEPSKPRKSRKKIVEPNQAGSFVSLQAQTKQVHPKMLMLNVHSEDTTPAVQSALTTTLAMAIQSITATSTPSQSSIQNFLKELRATNNAGAVKSPVKTQPKLEPKTMQGYENMKVAPIKGLSPLDAHKITSPSNQTRQKQDLSTSISNVTSETPDKPTKVINQKVCEKAPNTFARRNYMHKNEQSKVSKKKMSLATPIQTNTQPIIEDDIVTLQNLIFQSQGALSIVRGDKNQARTQACVLQYQPSVSQQLPSNVTSSNPLLTKILLTNQEPLMKPPLHSRLDSTVKTLDYRTPTSEADQQPINLSPRKTHLTENDQKDLANLLMQQNKLLQNSNAKVPSNDPRKPVQSQSNLPQVNFSGDTQEVRKLGASIVQSNMTPQSTTAAVIKQPDLIVLNKLYPNMSAVQDPLPTYTINPIRAPAKTINKNTKKAPSRKSTAPRCYNAKTKSGWENVLEELRTYRTVRKADDDFSTLTEYGQNIQESSQKKVLQVSSTKSNIVKPECSTRTYPPGTSSRIDVRTAVPAAQVIMQPIEKDSLDYPYLDDEMDKDLLKEIDELTSDEETRSAGNTRSSTPVCPSNLLNQSQTSNVSLPAPVGNTGASTSLLQNTNQRKHESMTRPENVKLDHSPKGIDSSIVQSNDRMTKVVETRTVEQKNCEKLQFTHTHSHKRPDDAQHIHSPKISSTVLQPSSTAVNNQAYAGLNTLIGTKIIGMSINKDVTNISKTPNKSNKIQILSNEVIRSPTSETHLHKADTLSTKQPNSQAINCQYMSKPHIPEVLKNISVNLKSKPTKTVLSKSLLESKILSLPNINVSKVTKVSTDPASSHAPTVSCEETSKTSDVMERLNREISEKILTKTSPVKGKHSVPSLNMSQTLDESVLMRKNVPSTPTNEPTVNLPEKINVPGNATNQAMESSIKVTNDENKEEAPKTNHYMAVGAHYKSTLIKNETITNQEQKPLPLSRIELKRQRILNRVTVLKVQGPAIITLPYETLMSQALNGTSIKKVENAPASIKLRSSARWSINADENKSIASESKIQKVKPMVLKLNDKAKRSLKKERAHGKTSNVEKSNEKGVILNEGKTDSNSEQRTPVVNVAKCVTRGLKPKMAKPAKTVRKKPKLTKPLKGVNTEETGGEDKKSSNGVNKEKANSFKDTQTIKDQELDFEDQIKSSMIVATESLLDNVTEKKLETSEPCVLKKKYETRLQKRNDTGKLKTTSSDVLTDYSQKYIKETEDTVCYDAKSPEQVNKLPCLEMFDFEDAIEHTNIYKMTDTLVGTHEPKNEECNDSRNDKDTESIESHQVKDDFISAQDSELKSCITTSINETKPLKTIKEIFSMESKLGSSDAVCSNMSPKPEDTFDKRDRSNEDLSEVSDMKTKSKADVPLPLINNKESDLDFIKNVARALQVSKEEMEAPLSSSVPDSVKLKTPLSSSVPDSAKPKVALSTIISDSSIPKPLLSSSVPDIAKAKAPLSSSVPDSAKPKTLSSASVPVSSKPKASPSSRVPESAKPKCPLSSSAPDSSKPKAPLSSSVPDSANPKNLISASVPVSVKPKAPMTAGIPASDKPKAPPSSCVPESARPICPLLSSAPDSAKPKAPPSLSIPASAKPTVMDESIVLDDSDDEVIIVTPPTQPTREKDEITQRKKPAVIISETATDVPKSKMNVISSSPLSNIDNRNTKINQENKSKPTTKPNTKINLSEREKKQFVQGRTSEVMDTNIGNSSAELEKPKLVDHIKTNLVDVNCRINSLAETENRKLAPAANSVALKNQNSVSVAPHVIETRSRVKLTENKKSVPVLTSNDTHLGLKPAEIKKDTTALSVASNIKDTMKFNKENSDKRKYDHASTSTIVGENSEIKLTEKNESEATSKSKLEHTYSINQKSCISMESVRDTHEVPVCKDVASALPRKKQSLTIHMKYKSMPYKVTVMCEDTVTDLNDFVGTEDFRSLVVNQFRQLNIMIDPKEPLNILIKSVSKTGPTNTLKATTMGSEFVDVNASTISTAHQQVVDVIDLLSDDDDEDDQYLPVMISGRKVCKIQSEFGTYKIAPMDKNILKKHQSVLRKKCIVRLEVADLVTLAPGNKPSCSLGNKRKKLKIYDGNFSDDVHRKVDCEDSAQKSIGEKLADSIGSTLTLVNKNADTFKIPQKFTRLQARSRQRNKLRVNVDDKPMLTTNTETTVLNRPEMETPTQTIFSELSSASSQTTFDSSTNNNEEQSTEKINTTKAPSESKTNGSDSERGGSIDSTKIETAFENKMIEGDENISETVVNTAHIVDTANSEPQTVVKMNESQMEENVVQNSEDSSETNYFDVKLVETKNHSEKKCKAASLEYTNEHSIETSIEIVRNEKLQEQQEENCSNEPLIYHNNTAIEEIETGSTKPSLELMKEPSTVKMIEISNRKTNSDGYEDMEVIFVDNETLSTLHKQEFGMEDGKLEVMEKIMSSVVGPTETLEDTIHKETSIEIQKDDEIYLVNERTLPLTSKFRTLKEISLATALQYTAKLKTYKPIITTDRSDVTISTHSLLTFQPKQEENASEIPSNTYVKTSNDKQINLWPSSVIDYIEETSEYCEISSLPLERRCSDNNDEVLEGMLKEHMLKENEKPILSHLGYIESGGPEDSPIERNATLVEQCYENVICIDEENKTVNVLKVHSIVNDCSGLNYINNTEEVPKNKDCNIDEEAAEVMAQILNRLESLDSLKTVDIEKETLNRVNEESHQNTPESIKVDDYVLGNTAHSVIETKEMRNSIFDSVDSVSKSTALELEETRMSLETPVENFDISISQCESTDNLNKSSDIDTENTLLTNYNCHDTVAGNNVNRTEVNENNRERSILTQEEDINYVCFTEATKLSTDLTDEVELTAITTESTNPEGHLMIEIDDRLLLDDACATPDLLTEEDVIVKSDHDTIIEAEVVTDYVECFDDLAPAIPNDHNNWNISLLDSDLLKTQEKIRMTEEDYSELTPKHCDLDFLDEMELPPHEIDFQSEKMMSLSVDRNVSKKIMYTEHLTEKVQSELVTMKSSESYNTQSQSLEYNSLSEEIKLQTDKIEQAEPQSEETQLMKIEPELQEINLMSEKIEHELEDIKPVSKEIELDSEEIEQVPEEIRLELEKIEPFSEKNKLGSEKIGLMSKEIEPVLKNIEPLSEEIELVSEEIELVSEEKQPVLKNIEPVSEEIELVSEEIELVSEEIQPVSEEIEPVSHEIEPVSEEIEPVSEEIEAVSQEIELVSEEIELVSEEIEPVSEEIEPVSETIELEAEKIEKSEKIKPVLDENMQKLEKVEPVSENAGSEKIEGMSLELEKIEPISEKIELEIEKFGLMSESIDPVSELVSEEIEPESEKVEPVSEEIGLKTEKIELMPEKIQPVLEEIELLSEKIESVSQEIEPVSEVIGLEANKIDPLSEESKLETEKFERMSKEIEPVLNKIEPVSEEIELVSEEIELVSVDIQLVSEEMEPVSKEIEPVLQEIELVSEEIELVSEEKESVSEEIEPVSEEIEPVSQEIEPVSEEIELLSEEIEPVAKEMEPVQETIGLKAEKIQKSEKIKPVLEENIQKLEEVAPVSANAGSEKIEGMSLELEKIEPISEKIELEIEKFGLMSEIEKFGLMSESTGPVSEKIEPELEKIEPVSDEIQLESEKVEPVSEEVGLKSEKIELMSKKIEPVLEEIKLVSEEIESVSQQIEPVSQEIEPVPEVIGLEAEKIEQISEKIEPVSEEIIQKLEKVEPLSEKPGSKKIERLLLKVEKIKPVSEKIELETAKFELMSGTIDQVSEEVESVSKEIEPRFEEIEPVLDKIQLKSDDSVPEEIKLEMEKIELMSEELELVLEKIEPVSEEIELVSEEIEPVSQEIEPVSEVIRIEVETIEQNSEKTEPVLEKIVHKMEKVAPVLDKPESEKIEHVSLKLEKIEPVSEKIELETEKFELMSEKIDLVSEEIEQVSEEIEPELKKIGPVSEEIELNTEKTEIVEPVSEEIGLKSEKIGPVPEEIKLEMEKIEYILEERDTVSEESEPVSEEIELDKEKIERVLGEIQLQTDKIEPHSKKRKPEKSSRFSEELEHSAENKVGPETFESQVHLLQPKSEKIELNDVFSSGEAIERNYEAFAAKLEETKHNIKTEVNSETSLDDNILSELPYQSMYRANADDFDRFCQTFYDCEEIPRKRRRIAVTDESANYLDSEETSDSLQNLNSEVEDSKINEKESIATVKNEPLDPSEIHDVDLSYFLVPEKTYSARKRMIGMMDVKFKEKKYRKGKCINYPRQTKADMDATTYKQVVKKLQEYHNSLQLTDKQVFLRSSPENMNMESLGPFVGLPADGTHHKQDLDPDGTQLFKDLEQQDIQTNTDQWSQVLNETISEEDLEKDLTRFPDDKKSDMGFGEGSDRVIVHLKKANISRVSAATLSDVKHQPFLSSENSENDRNTHNVLECSPAKGNRLCYKSIRSRVRSYFENRFKETDCFVKMHMRNVRSRNACRIFKNIPGLYTTDFLVPPPIQQVVQVVQVGQLPVSATAQNPVSCDPRVSQASDTSPSQCSVENSPQSGGGDNSSMSKVHEYIELTTANMSVPMVPCQEDSLDLTDDSKTEPNYLELQNVAPETYIQEDTGPKEVKNSEIVLENHTDRIIGQPQLHEISNSQYNNITEHQYNSSTAGVVTTDTPVQFVFATSQHNNVQESFSMHKENGSVEKNDQIANAMTAAGIATTNSRAQALVNILSQKIIRTPQANSTQQANNTYQKTSINTMALQQALAQILPPPLNQTNQTDSPPTSTVGPQVLHIVQGKNAAGNQITLVDNSQQSVISSQGGTQVLHIVQNKSTGGVTANGAQVPTSSFGGISLVEAGLQQGGNQLLHIVNASANQSKNNNTAQLLKRVNLLTSLANVQGSNEQKMVQFVCKSADGKSIQLNAPHQRSMVLRLQPIETPPPNVQVSKQESLSPSPNVTVSSGPSKDTITQQEIKSRSMYEENYAKFIQGSTDKPLLADRANNTVKSLPKFNQAFGKTIYQESAISKQQDDLSPSGSQLNLNNNVETTDLTQDNTNSTLNLDHIGQINSPPLLIRKTPTQSTQSQQNLVQQIKQTIAPMNIQTMHGGVIYTRQIPVNIGGGQTINLITVPSTELIDDNSHKQSQEVKFETDQQSIIKIIPQNQMHQENGQEETEHNTSSSESPSPQTQTQPVLTQMRIKLPMLSKTPQVVPGARVVRPFLQIQRNVIAGTNQPVYQQLVLTTAPPLGQQTIRLPTPQQVRQLKVPTQPAESNLSTSTLEQLREFDMVLEQVKERSTVQPSPGSIAGPFSNLQSQSEAQETMVTVATIPSVDTQQVLYSIGTNQALNVAYVNRKAVTTPTTTFVRSPDSSGIADSPTSTQMNHSISDSSTEGQPKPAKIGSKSSKSRPHKPSTSPSSVKVAPVAAKTSTQKPLEDEQTTQRILYILAEYKEQVENSPDKDKPAPRRRSNPPTNPTGNSKRKKSSGGSSRRQGRDLSPVGSVDDPSRTMGSEDSSCGTSQGDCTESCGIDTQSPQGSPRKVPRKLTFEQETAPTPIQQRPQQRNVIVADGQTIAVARSTGGKPATAVLMPANYLLPVSMMKGGQQIAIVTNRGPKILTMPQGEAGAANALLLQRLIGPAGLKPMLARPGVRHVRLPTATLHNLQAFNLAAAATLQTQQINVDTSSAPATAPNDHPDTQDSSPWHEDGQTEIKAEESCSGSEAGEGTWRLAASGDNAEYTYEEPASATPRRQSTERTVLGPIHDRYSPDIDAHRIFDKMFDADSKKSCESPRATQAYEMDVSHSDCEEKAFHQVVHKKEMAGAHVGSLRHATHVSAAALRNKYALLEHELRLQKSLSEECEDLGVDSPSASELFPEAELLFAASPAHDHSQEHHAHQLHHSHPPQAPLHAQTSIPQPDLDDQIATDHLMPESEQQKEMLDVNLGLGDVGIVTVTADGLQRTITLDHEEFARAHPNTTFHSEPTEVEVQQPFTIAALKTRHITSAIFHPHNSTATTVLMTAPAHTVISHAAPDEPTVVPQQHIKYSVADIDSMMNVMPGAQADIGGANLASVLVKDDGLTRFDSILTDSRELHLSNSASAIVHANATQVIRRVGYEHSEKTDPRDSRFSMDESDAIAGEDAKMSVAEDSSRDATLESMGGDADDDQSSPERHVELFWESNSTSERSEGRRPLDFSSDSDKCCKSPSLDETNSTDSSVGRIRLDSVIKEARRRERCVSGASSAEESHPPVRTYPAKRANTGDTAERSTSGKTRAGGERSSPESPGVRRRASIRGVVKRGCHCCNGSPEPSRPKKPRKKPDFSPHD